MSSAKLVRLTPFGGLIFAVIFIAGWLLASDLSYAPSGAEMQAFYEDSRWLVYTGAYMMVASSFFLIVYAASTWHQMKDHEGIHDVISFLALGGAFVAVALMMANAAIVLAAVDRAVADSGLTANSAATLADISGALLRVGLAAALGLHIIGVAWASLSSGLIPRWFAWLSLLLGVAMLSPVGCYLMLVAFPWIALVGVLGWKKSKRPRPAS
jgi:hypothetical protein